MYRMPERSDAMIEDRVDCLSWRCVTEPVMSALLQVDHHFERLRQLNRDTSR